MKKKDELKTEILTNIKDEIIDKQSEKRYRLMNRKRRPQWVLPSSIAATIVIAIMIPIFMMLFSKQVPIYDGMSVLSEQEAAEQINSGAGIIYLSNEENRSSPGFSLLANENENSGNHYGHDKKPMKDVIENDTSIGIGIPEQEKYYAEPGQNIYICVHISNPDSFEILSFTLNGRKYSSYMFEEGSDMENLILKVNVGDSAGILEYTIDAIKYIDGSAIKDVIMEGDRTISVGVYSADKQPSAQITDEFIGINKISFKAAITDTLELIRKCGGKAYAVICNNDSAIAQKELALDEINEISFEGLDTNTTYRYGIVAYYDSLDGRGSDLYVLLEEEFTTLSVVAVDNAKTNKTKISFSVVFNELYESKKLSSMVLFLENEKVKEFDVSGDITSVIFEADGLLSGKEYTLVLKYENLGSTETVEYTFKTAAKAIPTVEVTEVSKTQTSFSFEITATDVDSVGSITKLELIHGDDVKEIAELNTREIADLLSNNQYTVRVTYTYDLNDGAGENDVVAILSVKTMAKTTPTLKISSLGSTVNEINGTFEYADEDNVITSDVKVTLYKDGTVINTLNTADFSFEGLESFTEYNLKVFFNYDLNDGAGEQTVTKETKIKTKPYLAAEGCTILNTGAVYEGDIIYVKIDVDNPHKVSISSVTVNGADYTPIGASNGRYINVEIPNEGQFKGGTVQLTVESLNVGEYRSTVTENNFDEIFIYGSISAEKVEFVNENFEPIDWSFKDKTVYVKVTFDNPTGYELVSVNGNSNITKIDNNTYYLTPSYEEGYVFELTEFKYRDPLNNEGDPLTATVDMRPTSIIYVENTVYISSAEELMAIGCDDPRDFGEYTYYELSSDIDLSGKSWVPLNVRGVFNGNGKTVKNMSFVGSTDKLFYGMFGFFEGVITDLNIEGASFIINGNGYSKDGGSCVSCGVIVGTAHNFKMINCSVDETSFIRYTYNGKSDLAVGGMVGEIKNKGAVPDNKIENCYSYCSEIIVHTARFSDVGGIVGIYRANWSEDLIIYNCTSTSNVSGNDSVGGIIGSITKGQIIECENRGNISGRYAGGIIGGTSGNLVISGSSNNGLINGTENSGDIYGVCYDNKEGTIIIVPKKKLKNSVPTSTLKKEDILRSEL